MENEEKGWRVDLSDDDIRTLLYAVGEAIRVWPGSPARPAEEQQKLIRLRNLLFSMYLEMFMD